jgi:hypothetical protein
MLKLLGSIDKSKYSRRCYVVAATDKMSGTKAITHEQSWQTSPKVRAAALGDACAAGARHERVRGMSKLLPAAWGAGAT